MAAAKKQLWILQKHTHYWQDDCDADSQTSTGNAHCHQGMSGAQGTAGRSVAERESEASVSSPIAWVPYMTVPPANLRIARFIKLHARQPGEARARARHPGPCES